MFHDLHKAGVALSEQAALSPLASQCVASAWTSRVLIMIASIWWVPPIVAEDLTHPCLIEPFRKVELRTPIDSLIEAVHVDRGSYVQTGDVLVTLDSRVEQAALASARYRATMQGEIKVAEARLGYARDKLRRRDELSRDNFVSAQERDDALSEVAVAEAELALAAENAQLAALEQMRLEAVIQLRRLISPFAGVVTERLQHPGELAVTGETAKPILKLSQIDLLRVEVVLPVSLFGSIASDQRAFVEPEPPLEGHWEAQVDVVDTVVDSASGTFGVRLRLANPEGKIPAGVKCKVSFGT